MEFYREMSATIRAAKSTARRSGPCSRSLCLRHLHAAGPGHGKAVISSYLVANKETARRGIVLSFASALMQSLVAVVIVGVCAWLLNATAKTMCGTERVIEIASYALIAAFGARLVWTKGGGFMRALQTRAPVPAMAGAAHHHGHDHGHAHAHEHHHDIIMMITPTTITIMIPATSMTSIVAIRMARPRASWPAPAAGGAALARSWPSASGRARAPSWCWCSRWRRGCSGPASPRPS
jgi:ABC-type nickel/cobalt efflux system permease component RcnA